MAWLGQDPDEEIRWTESLQRARSRAQRAAAAWDRSSLLHLAQIARQAPWLKAGEVLALARVGGGPNQVQMLAKLSAGVQARRPGNGRPWGSTVTGAQMTPGHRDLFSPGQMRLLREDVFEGPRRTAQFEARYRRVEGEDISDEEIRRAGEEAVESRRYYLQNVGDLSPAEIAEDLHKFREAAERSLRDRRQGRFVERTDTPEFRAQAAENQAPSGGINPLARASAGIGGEVATAGRTLGMALAAPLQETEGQIRNVYGAIRGRDVDWWEPQSDLGIQITHPDLSAGSGFLVDPDSELGKERRRREAERGEIGGQVFTIGRFVASQFVEPGTTPYRVLSGLVDAAKQIYLDPTAVGAARLGKVSEARRLFAPGEQEATGLLRGLFTNSIDRAGTTAWMDGPEGSAVVKAIADEASPTAIWRQTNRKLTPTEVTALADAPTTDAVRQTLEPMLGTTFRSTRDVWKDPTIVGRRREVAMMPHAAFDLDDPSDVMVQAERLMRASHLPDETQVQFLDRLARARTKNDTFGVLEDVMAHTEGVMAEAGVGSPALRRQITRLFRNSQSDQRLWFVDEAGDNVSVWHDVAVGDDVIPGPSPHLSVEHINRFVPMPDVRAIKALTSRYPNLTKLAPESKLLHWPTALLDSWQNDIWKPLTLLRAAWPVRVIGEEQVRMAAAGLHSMFRHPISFVSWAVGRRGDTLGTVFDEADDFARAMVSRQRAGGWLDEAPGRVRTGRVSVFSKADEGYTDAWADELATLRIDPVARKLAQSENLDDAEEWFVNGPGRVVLDELTDAHPSLAEPGAARRYLETVARRIDTKTGGNDELLDAIRTGKLGDERILVDDIRPSPELRKALGATYFDAGPDAVKGLDTIYLRALEGRGVAAGWRRGVDWAFGHLMSRPTNYLSRSPAFRQFYWQRAEELVAFGDDAAKARILQGARDAKLPRASIGRLEREIPTGTLNADEVDALAKGYALDETKNLLYDMSEKSQFADAMRLVAPFGEAWREVVTRWAQLANPLTPRGIHTLRRAQQAITGARGEDFGEVMPGTPAEKGFFWRNEFGDEVFVYPGSEFLTGKLTDLFGPAVPIPLTGRVQGLNMIGNVFPGVGPVAAIPVSWFLPDKPGIQRYLRDLILPYGTITEEGETSALTQGLSFAPSWMRTAFQAFTGGGFDQESNRIYANTVMKTASYLYSTGRYDTSTPGGQQKLLEDAKDAAQHFYAIRALAAFGAPSAPSPDFLVKSSEGLVRWAMLRDDLYNLRDRYGLDEGDQRFLKRWGTELGDSRTSVDLLLQSLSRQVVRGVEGSQSFEDWRAGHQDLVRDFPAVYALFGPRGGSPDYTSYVAQIRRGEREALTPEEWLALSQNTLGWMQLDRARAKMPENPTDDDRAWLEQVEAAIREDYPGFQAVSGIEQRADAEQMFRELERAVTDKRISRTDAGKGLRKYWAARQTVLDYAKSQGLKTLGSETLAEDREWLRMVGEAIARENPAFSSLWRYALSAEVEEERVGA